MHYKQPVSVLVVVYTVSLDVLLLERADHPGYWQSVTGSCEPGEMLRDTALREVREETGLDALQYALSDWQVQNIYEIYPHWRHRYPPGVTRNTEHLFGLQVPQNTPVRLSPREHTAYQWLPYRQAAEACFSPSNAEACLLLPRFFQRRNQP